jgi:hypothetical protein
MTVRRTDTKVTPDGKVALRHWDVATKPDKVRLVKKHGYILARGTRPITQKQVRMALDEFPGDG